MPALKHFLTASGALVWRAAPRCSARSTAAVSQCEAHPEPPAPV